MVHGPHNLNFVRDGFGNADLKRTLKKQSLNPARVAPSRTLISSSTFLVVGNWPTSAVAWVSNAVRSTAFIVK